ncbi:MAG: NYN domain-containing protein [Rhodobacterales bacterium]|nr:MAG: NYN domain-containing protein [Rhodobacterales bacterium]
MTRVAIFIDGDNISASHAARIAEIGRAEGQVEVHRAYGNASNGSGWDDIPGVTLKHAGTGKNAADLLLSIDAIELALTGAVERFILASSDGDFTHLATRLREKGITVLGCGEAKAPARFQAACTRFVELSANAGGALADRIATTHPGPTQLDRNIREVIAQHSQNGKGMRLVDLNIKMRERWDIRVSTYPEGNWRSYFTRRPELFAIDPKGPDAFVRFLPGGFSR